MANKKITQGTPAEPVATDEQCINLRVVVKMNEWTVFIMNNNILYISWGTYNSTFFIHGSKSRFFSGILVGVLFYNMKNYVTEISM